MSYHVAVTSKAVHNIILLSSPVILFKSAVLSNSTCTVEHPQFRSSPQIGSSYTTGSHALQKLMRGGLFVFVLNYAVLASLKFMAEFNESLSPSVEMIPWAKRASVVCLCLRVLWSKNENAHMNSRIYTVLHVSYIFVIHAHRHCAADRLNIGGCSFCVMEHQGLTSWVLYPTLLVCSRSHSSAFNTWYVMLQRLFLAQP